jgi:solute carrier family 35 (UDP-sugar transporter), member A1/2/3
MQPSVPSLSERVGAFQELVHRENFATPMESLKLAIPAALQNNLIYVALANLEATTFQVGYQMKVITTALLSMCLLNRRLSSTKWAAIVALAVGIVLTQLKSGDDAVSSHRHQNTAVGLSAVVTCGCSSALAGVYFEKILKGTPSSVWMRNAQLAFFSILFGMLGVLFDSFPLSGFFDGYTSLIWVIIAVQALGGLIVAVVVKYADNILKGFATALSIVVCGFCSNLLFGFEPTDLFFFGSAVVMAATMLYSLPDKKPSAAPATTTEQHATSSPVVISVPVDSLVGPPEGQHATKPPISSP